MQSAILFLLASSMGVLFGWQPMPDGSPRYEYVVQLDPDLIATLEAGQTIPISSDIPEDIQPIGRIRIVVGRELLPRTRLSTLSNSLPKKSREGLIETQHRVAPVEPNASGRYSGSTQQSILPPSDSAQGNNQQIAQTPQRSILPGANLPARNSSQILPPQNLQGPQNLQDVAGSLQGATQQLGNQLRNVGESVRTDAQQMFGRTGSDAVSGALGQVGDTINRVQQGFQQGVEPLRQVAEQTGQQLRGAVEGIGQRTREAVDRFGRPLREQSILSTRENHQQTILPSGSAPSQQNFAGSQSNPRGQRLDQPISPPGENWQASPGRNSTTITPGNSPMQASSPPPAQTSTTSPRAFNTPWPSLPREDHRNNASQQPTQQPAWPRKTSEDRFDLANHPAASQPPTAGETRGRYDRNNTRQNNNWDNGPRFPSRDSNASPHLAAGEHNSHQHQGASNSSAPGISRDMLDRPADAPLLATDGKPAAPAAGPAFSQSALSHPSISQSPGLQANERQPQSADWGWDQDSRRVANNSVPRSEDSPRAVFPLLLSWVLLSGSAFGNVYLIWSFWDVRNKYRGLVHNARSSGSRH